MVSQMQQYTSNREIRQMWGKYGTLGTFCTSKLGTIQNQTAAGSSSSKNIKTITTTVLLA
jgi:hypothetical protein